jgi:hypothetical protein
MKHVFLVIILVMIVKEMVITAQYVKMAGSFLITLVSNVFMVVIAVKTLMNVSNANLVDI